jgi:prepilin-type N-terminal cleavage/methylation domain-containing protein
MRTGNQARAVAGQEGFSMIEMLMTTFILAIGLLGLCMLQTMSLRAGRGSRSLNTAVQVANSVMDQVEMEGRLSWLNLTNSTLAGTSNANLNLVYLPLGVGNSNAAAPQYFDIQGNPTNLASTDPTQNTQFFKAVTKYVDNVGTANGGTGQVSDFTVTVTFSDTISATNVAVPRTVVLTRRITHG